MVSGPDSKEGFPVRMVPLILLLLTATGCFRALPSAGQYPGPVPSAVQPAVSTRGDATYAQKGVAALRGALKGLDPEEALERIPQEGIRVPDVRVAARCVAAQGALPLLVCHFGPAVSQPVAQAILWYDRETWTGQLYPQAPPKVAAARLASLADLGCRVGCYGGIRQVRQSPGPELLVVADLGITGRERAEEVQLLHLVDGIWEVAWVPDAGDWHYGHTRVQIGTKGVQQFQVRTSSWLRQDSLSGYLKESESTEHRYFLERWMRKGQAYVMVDRAEEQTPYSSLVRTIHHLTNGADEKARVLIGREITLDQARQALAQNPRRQGWEVTRWGEHGFLLDTKRTGTPNLGVRFEPQGSDWVLAEIWPIGEK